MNFGLDLVLGNFNGLIDNYSPELTPNGTFTNNIDGYSARGSSTISHDATEEALFCNVTGVGGGFTFNFTEPTVTLDTYRVSIDIKNKTYAGGFKMKIGEHEGIVAAATTGAWVTYTVDIEAWSDTTFVELYRDGGTGEVWFDNLSITKI